MMAFHFHPHISKQVGNIGQFFYQIAERAFFGIIGLVGAIETTQRSLHKKWGLPKHLLLSAFMAASQSGSQATFLQFAFG